MADKFFSIRNWSRFQHYHKRNPPWIRLYQTLLRDRAYQKLSDTCRSHLVGLFLLASQHDNRLPVDQAWLRHELCTKTSIDLETLAASNWIQYESQDASKVLADGKMLASCKQDATPETETDNSDNTETDNSEVLAQPLAPKLPFGEFQSVYLSEIEITKLRARFNGRCDGLIDRLDRYSQTHPDKFKKYRSHYATILAWADKDQPQGASNDYETREERIARKNRETREEVARRLAAES